VEAAAVNRLRLISKPQGMKLLFLSVLTGILGVAAQSAELKPLDFQEVFSVIKTNLSDLTPEELSRSAALGLIKELGTKVQLVTTNESAPARDEADPILRRAVYNDSYGCLQIKAVNQRLADEFGTVVHDLISSNALKGLVLDLRFAGGQDYDAAAKVADLFAKGGVPLISLEGKEIRASEKSQPIDLPVAVLVNAQTSGSAEVLAATLREIAAGLIIGEPTAGEARLFETFTLSTGQKLRVGKIPVEVGDHKPIPTRGITPDILVTVDPGAEKVLYRDPFRALPLASGLTAAGTNELAGVTNRARRFNEAELVRRHREGAELDAGDELAAAPERPVVADPALARALDFLKGVAVLRQRRPL
jgi:C-terminal processing protease CtpA/Prc